MWPQCGGHLGPPMFPPNFEEDPENHWEPHPMPTGPPNNAPLSSNFYGPMLNIGISNNLEQADGYNEQSYGPSLVFARPSNTEPLHPQVLPPYNATQTTSAPLYFGGQWVPSRNFVSEPPTFAPPLLPYQPPLPMSRTTNSSQPPIYQRMRQSTSNHLYRCPLYEQNTYADTEEDSEVIYSMPSNEWIETSDDHSSNEERPNFVVEINEILDLSQPHVSAEESLSQDNASPLSTPSLGLSNVSDIQSNIRPSSPQNFSQPTPFSPDDTPSSPNPTTYSPEPTINSPNFVSNRVKENYSSNPSSPNDNNSEYTSSDFSSPIYISDSSAPAQNLPVGERLTSPILENPTPNLSVDEADESAVVPFAYVSHNRRTNLENGFNLPPLVSYRVCALSSENSPQPDDINLSLLRQVTNKVIRHARNNKTPNERAMCCPDCGLLPVAPVTGQCGHTRCTKCIQNNHSCSCGTPSPSDLHVNTVINCIIQKVTPGNRYRRSSGLASYPRQEQRASNLASGASTSSQDGWRGAMRIHRHSGRQRASPLASRFVSNDVPPRMPMSPQARLEHIRGLLSAGRYREAAPQLAHAAASPTVHAHIARNLLTQTIAVLSQNRDPRLLIRELYRSVRLQSAATWIKPTDLECVLCYHTYTCPVTTPCGHVYCRTCIERSLDYRKTCPLCLRSLDDFNLAETGETEFVNAALASIDAISTPPPADPDVIPIFVCTVAYPAIPCPLFIFDPRYWLMIRRVLESGSRKFGMVAYEQDRSYSDYGTILEVCDCVHLEDGRSIISTVGISRFKIIERGVRDGCDVARIQPLTDIVPIDGMAVFEMRIMAAQIMYKALAWINTMTRTLQSEIEAAFGKIPDFDFLDGSWWESPDGPNWLWWLIAILPLRSEIKVLILSTKSLLKRMLAVTRTLEAMDHVAITTTSTSECELHSPLNNAQAWLDRTA